MSHVATVKLKVKSLPALRAACKALRLEFREGQQTYKWYGRWMNDYHGDDAAYQQGLKPEDYGKCLHALRMIDHADGYEVGVVADPSGEPGSYVLVWDFWDKRLLDAIGRNGELLKRAYAEAAVREYAAKRGLQAKTIKTPAGKTRIILQK